MVIFEHLLHKIGWLIIEINIINFDYTILKKLYILIYKIEKFLLKCDLIINWLIIIKKKIFIKMKKKNLF